MKTKPNIKKTWIKPLVKAISVKKDTFEGTQGAKEAGTGDQFDRRPI